MAEQNQILAVREWGERVIRKDVLDNGFIRLEMWHSDKQRLTWMLIPILMEECESG